MIFAVALLLLHPLPFGGFAKEYAAATFISSFVPWPDVERSLNMKGNPRTLFTWFG
jgi:hypothetical protein